MLRRASKYPVRPCFLTTNDPAKTPQLSQARPDLARFDPQEGQETERAMRNAKWTD
jgi:hypothetical protein